MNQRQRTWFIFILASACVVLCFFLNSVRSEFVATHEWQDVAEGEVLPAGLHIRMDFQTGKKQAKLMENEKKEQDGSVMIVQNSEAQKKIDPEESALSKLTAEELKQVLEAFGMKAEDPAEIFNEMLANLISGKFEDKKADFVQLLEELDDAIHDIDLAKAFVDMGGVPHLERLLDRYRSDHEILSWLLSLVRSASQNNRYVSLAFFDSQVVHQSFSILEELLITPVEGSGNATLDAEKRNSVASKALSALSSILRACTEAKESFLRDSKFTNVLKQILESSGNSNLKIQRTAVGFIRNIVENRLFNESAPEPSLADIEILLMSDDWCARLLNLASGSQDLDILENAVHLLSTLKRYNFCTEISQEDIDPLQSIVESLYD